MPKYWWTVGGRALALIGWATLVALDFGLTPWPPPPPQPHLLVVVALSAITVAVFARPIMMVLFYESWRRVWYESLTQADAEWESHREDPGGSPRQG